MRLVVDDFEFCYRVASARDPRFDGRFFTGVLSTRIYCRPSCPAVTPRRRNVRFFRTAAAAQVAGLRACLRCSPDSCPGPTPEEDPRDALALRAWALIRDGVVDRDGVRGLAAQLHISERQLHRQLTRRLGAGAIALARSQRAESARTLIERTKLPFIQVAQAAGFGSLRQFNETVARVYGRTPSELRQRRRHAEPPTGATIALNLPTRAPFAGPTLLAFFGERAIPGIEAASPGLYRRTLRLEHGDAVAALTVEAAGVGCSLTLTDMRDLSAALERCRRVLDLDADPVAVADGLQADPVLAQLVRSRPGLRVPGHVDPAELAIRAVLGQQVTVAQATRLAQRLVALCGASTDLDPSGELTRLFPAPGAVADADLYQLPMPSARRDAVRRLARALERGDVSLGPGVPPDDARQQLLAIPGIGPWTASYIVMRAVGHPDEFLGGDAGVQRAARLLGLPESAGEFARRAEQWRPWRSYATVYLWDSLDHMEHSR